MLTHQMSVFNFWLNNIILDYSATSHTRGDTMTYNHDASVIFDPVCKSSNAFRTGNAVPLFTDVKFCIADGQAICHSNHKFYSTSTFLKSYIFFDTALLMPQFSPWKRFLQIKV